MATVYDSAAVTWRGFRLRPLRAPRCLPPDWGPHLPILGPWASHFGERPLLGSLVGGRGHRLV